MNLYKVTDYIDNKFDNNSSSNYTVQPSKGEIKDGSDDKTEKNEKRFNTFLQTQKHRLTRGRNIILLLLYLAYYSYAMYCSFGDEESIRLTVFTALGLTYLSWTTINKWGKFHKAWNAFLRNVHDIYASGKRPVIIRWFLYVVWTALFVVYIVINVALTNPKNLRPLGGMAVFIFVLFLFSKNWRRVHWHCVFYGTLLQCLFGLFVIKTKAGTELLIWCSDRLSEFLAYADAGSKFVFGDKFLDHPYAFQIMPSVIVFVAAVSVLIYVGIIQFIVRLAGKPLAFVLDVSAPESINAVTNILLSGAESGVTILEYLFRMPTSKLFCVCVGGFASCSGSALIQFRAFGVPLKYLLAASAMSAPAALVCAKIVYPDEDKDENERSKDTEAVTIISSGNATDKSKELHNEKETIIDDNLEGSSTSKDDDIQADIDKIFPQPKNVGEALVTGTKNGLKLVATIVTLMIVSLALVEFLDKTVEWLFARVDVDINLSNILSYLFYPCVYLMGIDSDDCLRAGEYLGLRTLATPGISYIYLGQIIRNKEIVANYTLFAASYNQTFTYDRSSSEIFLPLWNVTLPGGVFSEAVKFIPRKTIVADTLAESNSILSGAAAVFVWLRIHLNILSITTADDYLVQCGGCKKSPRTTFQYSYQLQLSPFKERSEIILTYALCGFASIPTVGVAFGLITTFIPKRLPDITAVSFRLLVAGTVASYLTACVAGILYAG